MSYSQHTNKKEKISSKIARVLNSGMAFMIAYLTIMFFFYLATALMGKVFGMDAQVYYYGVKFMLGRHRWTTSNVWWIWSASTFTTLFLGILCAYLYSYFKSKVLLVNLVTLWGAVISFSIVAAQAVLPCLASSDDPSAFYTNLSIAFAYLGLPGPVLYLICILFLVFLALFSAGFSKAFLTFSYSFSKVNKKARKRKYYFETVIVPFILGGALLLEFFNENYSYPNFVFQNVVYLAVIGFSLIVSLIVISISDMKQEEVLRYKNLQQINAVMFVILAALIIFLTVSWQGFYLPF